MTDTPRILIIDDEPTIQKMLVLTFRKRPWHVEAVGSAEEALERCRAQQYDLLLLDKNLPQMSGVELLRTLREEGDQTSCIMITAYGSVDSALASLSLGIDAYLEKPFDDMEEIARRVEEVLSLRHEGRHRSKGLVAARSHFRKAREKLSGSAKPTPLDRGLVVAAACPSQADRDFITEQLERDLVQFVLNASDLNDRLKVGGIDLVLVDALTAGRSLPEFVAGIRQLAPESSLVIITERLPLKVVSELIDLGVDALVERPLSRESFHSNLDRILSRLRVRG